ncbi:helix-turn-helix domain-containing protein [Ureibacillus endophyticus]|uniref:helix-turn-helix domain-containing protein n=1 Tax=Ureibacillus endophyticus TaxID=1978490 RepID=UPI00313567B4
MKNKLMLYLEIKQMADQGISIAQIARQLKISRTTVYKYLEMTPEESFEWVNINVRIKVYIFDCLSMYTFVRNAFLYTCL